MTITLNVHFCLFIQIAKSYETDYGRKVISATAAFLAATEFSTLCLLKGQLAKLTKTVLINTRLMIIYLSSPGLCKMS